MLRDDLEQLRATRARTLALTGGLTQAQLDYAPANGKWSAGEVLDHVLLAARANRDQIAELIALKKAGRQPFLRLTFADVNVSPAFIPKSALPLFEIPFTFLSMFTPGCVRDYMTRNVLVPARNPDLATPRSGKTAAGLRDELVSSLRELEELFAANPTLDYGEMRVQYPLLGVYDVPGLLRFMALHEQRHQSQMNDVLMNPRFPQSI